MISLHPFVHPPGMQQTSAASESVVSEWSSQIGSCHQLGTLVVLMSIDCEVHI
jgi:hypothetical protein